MSDDVIMLMLHTECNDVISNTTCNKNCVEGENFSMYSVLFIMHTYNIMYVCTSEQTNWTGQGYVQWTIWFCCELPSR